LNGSGSWHAKQAWLGRPAEDVLIEVRNGRITAVTERKAAPQGAVALDGWTIPGLADVHSHAFQDVLRGRTENGGADFWEWRREMFRAAEGLGPADYATQAAGLFRRMLAAGITAVGEFHYLHRGTGTRTARL